MVTNELGQILKAEYTILNSEDNADKCPKFGYPFPICKWWNEKNKFRFGTVNDFKWIETAVWDYFPNSSDYTKGVAIYSDNSTGISFLKNRLHESYGQIDSLANRTFTFGEGNDNIKFYLTMADLAMKYHKTSEEEVDDLVKIMNSGAFLEQIAAIELLAHSNSYKAYYHLTRLADYKISFESHPNAIFRPHFYHFGSFDLRKHWICQEEQEKNVKVEFVNASGELKTRLDFVKQPRFEDLLERTWFDYIQTIRCRILPKKLEALYNLVFNSSLRIRLNLGNKFDWKSEYEKIAFNLK